MKKNIFKLDKIGIELYYFKSSWLIQMEKVKKKWESTLKGST